MPEPGRIAERLTQLWDIALGPGGGADRPAFSAAEARAMLMVAGWAREAGLEPGLDPHGNLWALPEGWSGPVVTAGSHVDSVPDGGRYDGTLGTVLGVELVHDVRDRAAGGAARPGLLVCVAEEAPRFGAGTIGSRLLAGTLGDDALASMSDAGGTTATAARSAYLEQLGDLARVDPPLPRWRAHVEIHVAQRRSLRELGVVTRVASPRRFEVAFHGESGHAGEVPMSERRDALVAAAELVLAVDRAAGREPPETVATVGTLAVSPGAVSVIPGLARLGIDVRGVSSASLRRLDAAIRESVEEIAQRRGVPADLRLVRDGEPVALDRGLADSALAAARRLGIAATETWSGAGHDAQHLSALVAALLLFVPLHGGESHTPQEECDMNEIVQAASVAADILSAMFLDSGPGL